MTIRTSYTVAASNARLTVAAPEGSVIGPEWEDPAGVPIEAFLIGGRRASVVPRTRVVRLASRGQRRDPVCARISDHRLRG
jgi:GTP-dependent phosphoenolpyruvate carboxykinase